MFAVVTSATIKNHIFVPVVAGNQPRTRIAALAIIRFDLIAYDVAIYQPDSP
jgi:hypothetical protein